MFIKSEPRTHCAYQITLVCTLSVLNSAHVYLPLIQVIHENIFPAKSVFSGPRMDGVCPQTPDQDHLCLLHRCQYLTTFHEPLHSDVSQCEKRGHPILLLCHRVQLVIFFYVL